MIQCSKGTDSGLYWEKEFIMPLLKKMEKESYTYADVLEWEESLRAEIIDGKVYMMSPPVTFHQRISRALFLKIGNFLEGKSCEVFAAPFGVRLFPQEDNSDNTLVEPDIVVVCDSSKLDDKGCNGAPDMVIEILSPSTASNDCVAKFNNYLKAGVREYWILDPETRTIQVHLLDQEKYTTTVYEADEKKTAAIPVSVLPGCKIDLKTIFVN
jgi:Uma2 family endonuclease